jgi:phosphinothricin acetyltransferase
VPTVVEFSERIARVLQRLPWLVCQEGDEVLGYAYATLFGERAGYRWSVEAAIYVAPEVHRRGLGRMLYAKLFQVLRAQGYCNVYAGITLPNEASVALHRSLGFVEVGTYQRVGYKNGAWHDTGWYQLRLWEPHGPPPEPVSLAAVASELNW